MGLNTMELDALRKMADWHRLTAASLPKDSKVAGTFHRVAGEYDDICDRFSGSAVAVVSQATDDLSD